MSFKNYTSGDDGGMITKRDINSIESLLLLLAVTQHSNKRKASEALNTSVDTINKYIDNLEQDLSLKLLYSDSRGTNLTEMAKDFGKRQTDNRHYSRHVFGNHRKHRYAGRLQRNGPCGDVPRYQCQSAAGIR